MADAKAVNKSILQWSGGPVQTAVRGAPAVPANRLPVSAERARSSADINAITRKTDASGDPGSRAASAAATRADTVCPRA